MPLVIVDLPFSKGRFNATHSCRLPDGKQSAATHKIRCCTCDPFTFDVKKHDALNKLTLDFAQQIEA